MDKISVEKDSIRNHIDTIILCLLSERDRYGYEMYKEVLDRTQGAYELKEPSMYSAIRRLEEAKLISSYWGDESQGGRRKYYHLAPEGETAYQRSVQEWENVKLIMDKILKQTV
jgi:Predicted transcriptional regulators